MPGGVVPFDLFVSHNAPHVAKVNRDALREHGDDLRFLFTLLAADRLFLGRIAGNGLHAQQILNKREFLFSVVVQKAKIAHAPEASGQYMGEELPDKMLAA